MRFTKTFSLAAFAGALALTSLHASEWDKKTTITINAPVQIPSTILQPGTYTLKLMDSASDRHIVTVWDKDGMHLITTILAIPNYRLKPSGESKFTFWETSAGKPAALRAWFYPGDNFGQEFAYPKSTAQQLSTVTHDEVPTLSAQDESKFGPTSKNEGTQMATTNDKRTPVESAPVETATSAPVTTTTSEPSVAPEPTPAQVVSAAATAPSNSETATALSSPDPVASPAPSAAQAPSGSAPSAMPETSSNWNETMSFGLLLSLTGLSTFLVRKRSR